MTSTKIIRLKELEKLIGLSKTTIGRLELLGKFPKRIKLTDKLVDWKEKEILEWIIQKPQYLPSKDSEPHLEGKT